MNVFARAIVVALLLVAVLAGPALALDPTVFQAGSAYTNTGSIKGFDADGNEIPVTYFDRPGFDTVTVLAGSSQFSFVSRTVGSAGGPLMLTTPSFSLGCDAHEPFPYRTMRSAAQVASYNLCWQPTVWAPGSTPGVFGVIVDETQQVPVPDPITGVIEYQTQVFDDWIVTNQDTDATECHAGDVGLRTPNLPHSDGVTPGHFGIGPEYRVWTDAANDVGMRASFEAHYARVSPDISAPLYDFDEAVECAVVEQDDSLPISFSCREPGNLGSGVESCVLTDRSGAVLSGESLDTSVLGTNTFTITATDEAGNVRARTMTYTVVEGSTTFSPAAFYENQPIGTLAGTLVTSNEDEGDNWLYELVPGAGDDDNSLFAIDGNGVTSAALFDHEDRSEFSIRVRATDVDNDRSREYVFPITLLDVAGDVQVSPHTIAENLPADTLVGQIRRITIAPYEITLAAGVGDDDNALFRADCGFSATCELRTRAPLDFEGRSTYTVRLSGYIPFFSPPRTIENYVTIRVTDANDTPTGVTLSSDSILEGSGPDAAVGDLAAIDEDANDTHTFALVPGEGDADNGLFAISGSSLRALDSIGESVRTVRIRATDAGGAFVEQSFPINITYRNRAPIADDDSYSAVSGTELTVAAPGVLDGDTDPESGALTAVLGTGPSHASGFTLNGDGSFTYTPEAGYTGQDTFTYTADDGDLQSALATVTITVRDANRAPTATDDRYATNEDVTLTVTAAEGLLRNDSDPDDDELTAILVDGPDDGTLTLNDDGSFTYVPDANDNGPDSFTYKASDGDLESETRTVSINVRPVDDAPTIAIAGGSCTSETAPSGTVTVRVADIDTADGGLTVTAARPNGSAVLPANSVSVSGSGSTRTVTINATATKPGGSGVVTVLVNDGSSSIGVTVNVIVGSAKNETLAGTVGTDLVFGLGGVDTISGAGSIDILCGGQGDDVLRGGDGDDVLHGHGGADTLEGGNGADSLFGGGGGDTLRGGDGDDTLRGQGGADVFTGGAGSDAYADFSLAEGDSQTEAP